MEIVEEPERRECLTKLEVIENALPQIKKAAKDGKFRKIPYKNLIYIDCLTEGIFAVNIKEATVSFRLCPSDLLDKKQRTFLTRLHALFKLHA